MTAIRLTYATALALTVVLLLATVAFAGDEARLKTSIVVDSEVVTLGDLFEGAGPASAIVIAPAPAPGQRQTLPIGQVAAAARQNGISWNGRTRARGIMVERAGQRIPVGDIEHAIESALRRDGLAGDRQVRLSNSRLALFVPLAADAGVAVEHVDFDRTSGRFQALVAIPDGDATVRTVRITGRAISVVGVPVLKSAVAAGQPINPSNIGWARIPANRLSGNIISERSQLSGKIARRALRPAMPVRSSDIRSPVTIAKGSQVIMVVSTPGMTLTALGRALEDGATGQTIRILNPATHTTISAVVVSASEVRVPLMGRIISAMR